MASSYSATMPPPDAIPQREYITVDDASETGKNDNNNSGNDEGVCYMDEYNRLTDSAMDRFSMATLAGCMGLRRKKLLRIGYDMKSYVPANKPLGWVRSHSVSKIVREVERIAGGKRNTAKCRIDEETKKRLMRCAGLGDSETKKQHKISDYDTVLFCLFYQEHWSVLVCYAQSKGCKYLKHYDTLFPYHAEYAVRVKDSLVACGMLPKGTAVYETPNYPQQESFYECGYSVLLLVSIIGNEYAEKKTLSEMRKGVEELKEDAHPETNEGRAKMLAESIFLGLGKSRMAPYPSESKKETKEELLERLREKVTGKRKLEPVENSYKSTKRSRYKACEYNHFRQEMLKNL